MIRNLLLRFCQNESGNFAIITALSTPVLIGAAALGTEVGYAYMKQSALQSTAEMAVISAANAAMYDGTDGKAEAFSIAASMGAVNKVDGITVTVNSPPRFGAYAGVAGDIEVMITKEQPPMLEALFLNKAYTITGRSVARVGTSGVGKGCIIGLDSGNTGLNLKGSVSVDMTGCDAYVNSNSSDAADINGNANFTVDHLNAVGSVVGSNLVHGETDTGASPIADPYANVPFPSQAGCDYQDINVKKTPDIVPKGSVTTICGGLKLTNGDAIVFEPGVYVFQDGALSMSGGTLTANGVTFAFADGASAQITGGAATITAPSTGSYQGMAVMASANNTNTFKLTGGTQTITGVIHLPAAPLQYSGNSSSTGSGGCTQIVAGQITFTGTVQIGSECKDLAGVKSIGGFTPTALLE